MVDDALLVRVDAEALRRGQTRRVFTERALEAALSEPVGSVAGSAPGRPVVVEPQQASASPRAPVRGGVGRAEAFRRAGRKP